MKWPFYLPVVGKRFMSYRPGWWRLRAQNPPCSYCGKLPQAVEIEGRVLVCTVCAADEDLREHARADWR